MGAFCGGDQPIILFGRHQHELAPAVPRDLDGLTLSLMLELTELALEFQGSGLNHGGCPKSVDGIHQIRIIRILSRDVLPYAFTPRPPSTPRQHGSIEARHPPSPPRQIR